MLNELQAREILHDLHQQHDAQHGLCWEDLTESIQQSGLGRDINKRELHRFIHRDHITIDPPLKRKERR